MSIENYSPMSLVGRVCTFKDLHFERSLKQYDFRPDFPEHLRSPIVTGLVQGLNLHFPVSLLPSLSIEVDDSLYDLVDIELISIMESLPDEAIARKNDE